MNDLRRPIDEALWCWRLLHTTENPSREVCDTVVEPVPLAHAIPLAGNADPAEPATQKWTRWGDRVAAKIADQKAISAAHKTVKDQTNPVRQRDATE